MVRVPGPFALEWVNWSGGGEELTGLVDTVVPKSIGEALASAIIRLRRYKNVKDSESWKV